jgi:hypothetical protein
MNSKIAEVCIILALIRKICSYYYQKRIKPFLKYYNIAEIDETKVGTEIAKKVGNADQFRWVFGMICRRTKLSSLYFVKNRKIERLHELIKAHCMPGAAVFSDSAS